MANEKVDASTGQKVDASTGQKVDASTGQFIDPMFAVIIAAAVSETIVIWVKAGAFPPAFTLMVVSLGYVNLLLSWFGYHKSVYVRQIRGSARFVITVVLLPVYLMTIIMFSKPFIYTAAAYAIIFFLWSVWEYLKFVEHHEKQGFWRLQLRPFNLIVYAVYVYELVCNDYVQSVPQGWIVSYCDAIGIALIGFAILYLRLQKSASNKGNSVAIIIDEFRSLLLGKAK